MASGTGSHTQGLQPHKKPHPQVVILFCDSREDAERKGLSLVLTVLLPH